MELLQQVVALVLPVSLAALVLSIGLDAGVDDVLYLVRRPGLLLKAFLAISVIVPLAAVVAMSLLPTPPLTKAGIILMALAPVPPLVPGKGLKLGGRKAYVYGLYVTFALLAVVIVPVTARLLGAYYGREVEIPAGAVAKTVLVSVLAPLALGMVIRVLAPKAAAAAAPWVNRLSMLLLLAAFLPIVVSLWPAISSLVGNGTVVGIAFIVAAALAGGHLLGGPDPSDRAALASAAATRHPGIALMIATANTQDKRVVAAILLFLLVSLAVVAIYQVWLKRSAKAAQPGPAGAA